MEQAKIAFSTDRATPTTTTRLKENLNDCLEGSTRKDSGCIAGRQRHRRTATHPADPGQRAAAQDRQAVEFTTSDLEIQVRTSESWVATRPASTPRWERASSSTSCVRCPTTRWSRSVPRRTSSRCRPARAASRCRRCRPRTFRWSTRRRFRPGLLGTAEGAARLVNQVHFAMAVHDIRYYLNGILFIAEGKQLTLVATDGHRLALARPRWTTRCPSRKSSCRARRCSNCSAC